LQKPGPVGSWVWRRGDDVTVALNLGAEPVMFRASMERSHSRRTARDGERVGDILSLAPGEATIVSCG